LRNEKYLDEKENFKIKYKAKKKKLKKKLEKLGIEKTAVAKDLNSRIEKMNQVNTISYFLFRKIFKA
jgi:hypothetical protein